MVIDYLVENYKWMFSGIGVLFISWLLIRHKNNDYMKQNSGKNSKNIQVGGNLNISGQKNNSDE